MRTLLLALALSSFASVACAQKDDETPSPEDALSLAMGGAALSTGVVAFDAWLETRTDDAFGPRRLLDASLSLSIVGALAVHVGAFALVSPRVRRDRVMRALLAGVSLLGTGASLLALAMPTAWALTVDPPRGDESIAIVAPYLLGAIGVVALVSGALVVDEADDAPRVTISVGPQSAMITVAGTF